MMRKFDVQIALEKVAEMRAKWATSKREFDASVNQIMRRLLHEAAHNYMSAEEVASASGLKVAQVRSMMRLNGLDPRNGKTLLAKHAAKALEENADLLGISVHDMDLMSPLAYLPMGEQLKQQLLDARVAQVHELPYCTCDEPDSSGSLNGGIEVCMTCGYEIQRAPETGGLPELPERFSTEGLEHHLYEVIVRRFEGMGEAWTTDESGDTLARAAAEEAARLVSGNPS